MIGLDSANVAYVIHEIYAVEQDIEWWSEKAEALRNRFDIQRFTCDPSRPDSIAAFNRRMVRHGGYHAGHGQEIAGGASNAIAAGLSIVRERLAGRTLFILSDCLESRDPKLEAAKKPCCLAEEIPSYIYAEVKDGRPTTELPMLGGDDHGNDSLRYGCLFLDQHDWRPPDPTSGPSRNSYAAVLNHGAAWSVDPSVEAFRRFQAQQDRQWRQDHARLIDAGLLRDRPPGGAGHPLPPGKSW